MRNGSVTPTCAARSADRSLSNLLPPPLTLSFKPRKLPAFAPPSRLTVGRSTGDQRSAHTIYENAPHPLPLPHLRACGCYSGTPAHRYTGTDETVRPKCRFRLSHVL